MSGLHGILPFRAKRPGGYVSDREIAELAEFYVERMHHLTRLASVTDPLTLARYLAALHFEMRPRFDALAATLDAEAEPASGDLPN